MDDFEVRMIAAGSLYEKGKLTAGQAAEVVGISKREFIEMLGKFGYSVFGYTAEELSKDLDNLERWRRS